MNPDNILESQGINKVLSDFAKATGLAVVLTDINGTEVSELFNVTEFCTKLREIPELHERCQNSDKCGGLEASKSDQPCIYRCHAGLVDFSIPLKINDHLIGFVLSGQVRTNETNEIDGIKISQMTWTKNTELVDLYSKIKVVSDNQVLACADLLKVLVDDSIKKDMDFVVINDKFNLHHLFNFGETHQIYEPKIMKAMKYIEGHYFENISLDEVADHVYLSSHYFSKLFKKEVGVGFNNYVNQQRLLSAKKMLESSDWSISRISYNLGYSCASYFCKVFKSNYKMTPEEYRKTLES
jgi:ligand-binding sensor protein/AraC-like DNA-binding protein